MSISRSESYTERICTTNLRLLGFYCEDKDVVLSPEMFDHANHKAFQQVMYFLLCTLDKEKVKTEFRDCWPTLDKKQEAEFRKKVVLWIKDLQRENPSELTYVNPALFQSPGGRKFVQFLRTFSTFVLKQTMEKEGTHMLNKPVCKSKQTQKLMFTHLVDTSNANLSQAVRKQAAVQKTFTTAVQSAEVLTNKYFEMKSRKEEILRKLVEQREKIVLNHKGESNNFTLIQDLHIQAYPRFKDRLDQFKGILDTTDSLATNVINVTDKSIQRPTLDFTIFNKQLVNETNLALTYENLLKQGALVYNTCAQIPVQHHWKLFPKKSLETELERVRVQSSSMREMKPMLETLREELTTSVSRLSAQADQVDWNTRFLDESPHLTEVQVLLPPTPALGTEKYLTVSPDIISKLKLLTPSDKSVTHQRRTDTGTLQVPDAHTPTGPSLNRKFARKITPDPSPLLRVSLIQSALRRTSNAGEDSVSSQVSDYRSESKISIDCFSPGLSSTRLRKDDAKVETEEMERSPVKALVVVEEEVDEEVDEEVFAQNTINTTSVTSACSTQSKIEMYRRVLETVSNKLARKPKILDRSNFRFPPLPSSWSDQDPPAEDTASQASTLHNESRPPSSTNIEEMKVKNSDLLGIWTQVRSNISPRTSPVERSRSRLGRTSMMGQENTTNQGPLEYSPLITTASQEFTPRLNLGLGASPAAQRKCETELKDMVTTRLDALMDSLTLSDNSLDITVGRMSFGELLMSPHCP